MYIDLAHTFFNETPAYPGDSKAEVMQTATIQYDGFADHAVKFGVHVGTHMDAPEHFIEGGKKISELELTRFFGQGILIDVRGKETIDVDVLQGIKFEPGMIILIWTDWSKKFGQSEYWTGYPAVTEALAGKFIKAGVNMVGLDCPGPDYIPFPIHKVLLKNEILLLENLTNLDQLSGRPAFEVIALPPKFATNAAPVRVVARVE